MTEPVISTIRNQSFWCSPIVRIFPIFLSSVLLSGCVGASNWLSGSPQFHDPLEASTQYFAPMRIGTTPVKEVVSRYGVPDDTQFGSIDGMQIESLGYSSSALAMPFQYIPLFGAIEIWRQETNHTPSAAISFSTEERLSGLTVSSHNAYGDIRPKGMSTRANSSMSFYGMNNPAVFHTATTSTEHLP